MSESRSRRDFLKLAGLGTAGCVAGVGTHAAAALDAPAKAGPAFELALASYTTRKFDLDQTLAIANRVGLKAVCLKSFHLALDATDQQIAEARTKVEDAGIVLYGGGVVGMKNAQQIEQGFEYAKKAGMSKIIIAPSPDMLDAINEKVRQYDIAVCIHNHGPGDAHFATPVIAYEQIKNLDKRFGLCHDVGHTKRFGKDPIAETIQCADRLLDIHFKDVTAATKSGHCVQCGRGVIDMPKLIRALVEIGYSGYAAFEYEENPSDPLPGLAESVGYVRGVIDAI